MRNLVLVFALAFALPSHAAEITMNHGSDGLDIVSINGTFNAGDEAVFKKIAAESNRAVVVLNSGGGNLVTELEIGRAIRFRGFATAVPEGRCARRPAHSPGWRERLASWTTARSSASMPPTA